MGSGDLTVIHFAVMEVSNEDVDENGNYREMWHILILLYYFAGFRLAHFIYRKTDDLSKALQATSLCAAQGKDLADTVIGWLREQRTDSEFHTFYSAVLAVSQDLGKICLVFQNNAIFGPSCLISFKVPM